MEQPGISFSEPIRSSNTEAVRVLQEVIFNNKYPKASLLSDKGNSAVVWNITGSNNTLRKELQPEATPDMLMTEAVALSRIHRIPIDVMFKGRDMAIAVPKANGESVGTFLLNDMSPSMKERYLRVILPNVVGNIVESHQAGVIIKDVKLNDAIVDPSNLRTTWIDFSNGFIMPRFSQEAVEQIQENAEELRGHSVFMKQAGGEKELGTFLKNAEALARRLDDYKSGRTPMSIDNALPEILGWHTDGVKLLKNQAVRAYFGEQKVNALLNEVDQELNRKFFESKEYKQGLHQQGIGQVEKINTFLSRLVGNARKWEHQLDIQYTAQGVHFSSRAGELISARLANMLGYEDASLLSVKGIPIVPRVPFYPDSIRNELSELRTGKPLQKTSDEAVHIIEKVVHELVEKNYTRFQLQDWEQLYETAPSQFPSARSDSSGHMLAKLQNCIRQMQPYSEAGDVEKMDEIEKQLLKDLG